MTHLPAPPLPASTAPGFGLIIIGDEILSGKRADKHLPKVIELLKARGLQLDYADYVGDSPDRLTATLKRAFASGDAVFSCGGIGATPDDHTRQCAARATGAELVLHPQADRLIRERMQDLAKEQGTVFDPDHPDNIHRLNMGMFPLGAHIIPNPFNKIPGFFCVRDEQFSAGPPQGNEVRRKPKLAPSGGSDPHAVGERGGVFFVPGFPVMAWPMIEWVLDTHYPHLFRTAAWIEKSVIVMGAMEAMLTPLMQELERIYAGVKVFSLPSVDHPQYGRHIELGVKGEPDLVAQAYPALLAGLQGFNAKLGPELVRN
ncbi:MAG: competence/damage-inducible protein A [Rhodoferax sp.]|uniref:competence/damage-inducible protein A n=1 Tax=Rhodoferax sp. TaxID=50421 RepID=UPI0017EAE12E|nr:molybdopterin-binding protein [Rhodoferax sp.]NMM19975.1 competence/damage-inducible protein A [Rhodoferax sp.]